MRELAEKEKQTIAKMTATLNHELNTPLAIIDLTVKLSHKNGELKDIDKIDSAIDNMKDIIGKIDSLTEGKLEKTSYRESGAKDSNPSEIYRV